MIVRIIFFFSLSSFSPSSVSPFPSFLFVFLPSPNFRSPLRLSAYSHRFFSFPFTFFFHSSSTSSFYLFLLSSFILFPPSFPFLYLFHPSSSLLFLFIPPPILFFILTSFPLFLYLFSHFVPSL